MTVPPAPLTPTDITGVLTGASGLPVHARVRLAPPPQITPAALSSFLRPVRDATGAVRDYTLDHAALFADPSGAGHGAVAEFRAWRARWLLDVELGELGAMQAFTATARTLAERDGDDQPLRVLPRLQWAEDVIDSVSALILGDEVEETRQLLRAEPRTGIGILDTTRRGFVRTVAPAPDEVVLLAAGSTRVLATGGALVLDYAGGPRPSGLRSTEHQLTGWTVTGAGVVAHTTDGDVPLGGTVAERLLTWLAPGTITAELRPVPLTTVWAKVLAGLSETTAAAIDAAGSIELQAGSPAF